MLADVRASVHDREIPEATKTGLLTEVGSEELVPALDKELEGKRKGEILKFNATLPESFGPELSGQEVTFRVDAYPDRVFHGTVTQVRLQPTTVQNVVTYNTIIGVDNADGRIMPGMTATVSVIIRKSENALRIPAAALRFRPEGFEAGNKPRSAGAPGAAGGGAGNARAAASQGAMSTVTVSASMRDSPVRTTSRPSSWVNAATVVPSRTGSSKCAA